MNMYLVLSTHSPIEDAVLNFPGGPLVLMLILAIPLFAIAAVAMYMMIKSAYAKPTRRQGANLDSSEDGLKELDSPVGKNTGDS